MKLSRLLPLLALAFALTAAEKSPLVLDTSNRPSVLTAADVIRLPSAGPFFTGIYPTATADRDITLPDATTTLAGLGVVQTFTAAQTVQSATGITSLQAATQDAVRIIGRAGGSSSFVATITPPTLAGNVTITLPAATSALATLALTETLTGKTLTSPAINTATIIGGTANDISLGATTRSTAAVTTLNANGAVTFTSTLAVSGVTTLSDNITLSGLNREIRGSTSDGADTQSILVTSAGAASHTRGAFFEVIGNERASTSFRGVISITAGFDAAFASGDAGSIRFNAGGAEKLRMWRSGGLDLNSAVPSSDPGAGSLRLSGSIFMSAGNINTDTTTGTKIGTATGQKIGFWNAAPVVQPSAVIDATGGATVDTEARAAINALLSRMRTVGMVAP